MKEIEKFIAEKIITKSELKSEDPRIQVAHHSL